MALDIIKALVGKVKHVFHLAAIYDLEADIGGALAAGIAGIQVRTGKFRPDATGEGPITPTMLIESIADVPALVGITGSAYT